MPFLVTPATCNDPSPHGPRKPANSVLRNPVAAGLMSLVSAGGCHHFIPDNIPSSLVNPSKDPPWDETSDRPLPRIVRQYAYGPPAVF